MVILPPPFYPYRFNQLHDAMLKGITQARDKRILNAHQLSDKK
jgi:hypothetical protein